MADQTGRGCFSVRARDTNIPAFEKGCGKFDFADDCCSSLPCGFEGREVGGHIRREHDQFRAFEKLGRLLRERDVETIQELGIALATPVQTIVLQRQPGAPEAAARGEASAPVPIPFMPPARGTPR